MQSLTKCQELKALVIGATGGGKSSLINLFYCWSQGWDIYDILSTKKVLIKTKYFDGDGTAESNINDQGQSQTTIAKLYQFYVKVPHQDTSYLLNFLDTPGLGDTRGSARDDKNIELISETVSKTEELNAIILVMNGAEARLNSRVKYILKKLHSIIPSSLVQNVMVLLTNVGLEPSLKVQEVLDFEIDDSRLYWYDNQVFNLPPKYFTNNNMLARCQQTYNEAIGTISDMLQKIASLPVVTTQAFSQIQEMRDRFKRDIVGFCEIICRGSIKKAELQSLYSDIDRENIEISNLESRLGQCCEEDLWKTVLTHEPNTICCACKSTCHERCTLQEERQGDQRIKNCIAFNTGKSEICRRCNHSYKSHMRLNERYVKQTSTANGIKENIKASIQGVGRRRDTKVALMKTITHESEKITQEQHIAKSKILSLLKDIRKVCSRFNYIKQIDDCIHIFQEQLIDLQKEGSKVTLETAFKIQGLLSVQKTLESLKDEIVKGLQTESQLNVEENPENRTGMLTAVNSGNLSNKIGTQRASSYDNRRNIDTTRQAQISSLIPQKNFQKESVVPVSSREGLSTPRLGTTQSSRTNSHFPIIGSQQLQARKGESKIDDMKINQSYLRGRQMPETSPNVLDKSGKLREIEKNLETLLADISMASQLDRACAEELQESLDNFNRQVNSIFKSRDIPSKSDKYTNNYRSYQEDGRSVESQGKNGGLFNKALGYFGLS